MWFLGSSTGSL